MDKFSLGLFQRGRLHLKSYIIAIISKIVLSVVPHCPFCSTFDAQMLIFSNDILGGSKAINMKLLATTYLFIDLSIAYLFRFYGLSLSQPIPKKVPQQELSSYSRGALIILLTMRRIKHIGLLTLCTMVMSLT